MLHPDSLGGAQFLPRWGNREKSGAQSLVKFYFDYISPNAYLAWTQLPRLIGHRRIEIERIPILFSAILDAQGQKGPAEIPAKMRWMVRDILWKAKRLEVPLNSPASHPFNPLLALRVSSLHSQADGAPALISAIFEAVWVRRIDVGNAAALAEVINSAGLPGDSLVARAALSETKNLLRRNTASAIELGVFGVPSMLVEKHLFWGLDDFPHIEALLDGDLSREQDIREWEKTTPSAWRKNPC